MNADAISRIKAVRGHHSCQNASALHSPPIDRPQKCTIQAPRLWQLPHFLQRDRDSGARAVALRAEECEKRLYLLPPPRRHVPGWTQLRTLALILVTDGVHRTERSRRLCGRRHTETQTALSNTHKYSHI